MTKHVALLRGINVGGKNKLPMKDLAAMFDEAGGAEVRTFIQSGNVVFAATATTAKRIGAAVTQAIADRFGFDVPIVLRSADELAAVVRENPFLRAKVDVEKLHVGFLAGAPSKKAIAALDPKRSPPDEHIVVGREVFLHLPNGAGRSKLTTGYFDRVLETTSTFRNWRTVLALHELASSG